MGENSLLDPCNLSRGLVTWEAFITDIPESRRRLREQLSEGCLSNVYHTAPVPRGGPEQGPCGGFSPGDLGVLPRPPSSVGLAHFPIVCPLFFLD